MPPRFAGVPVAPKVAPIPYPPMGMVRPGNIDPHNRPVVKNADGSISTVRTISAGIDGNEVLLPTVSPDGRIMSDDQAIDRAMTTGEDFGAFNSPDAATRFAERLHNSQADEYLPATAPAKKPRFAGVPVNASTADPYLADLPVPGGGPGYVAPTAAPKADGGFNETAFAQGTSGINEGIATALGAPVDLTNLALRAGAAGLNAATGSNIQLPVDAFGGRKTFETAMAPAIKPESENGGNQVIRRVGQEIGSSLLPAGGVVARSARPIEAAVTQATVALGSGAAAAGAQYMAPDNPYIEMAAQILGGGGAAAAIGGVQKAVTPFAITADRAAMNNTMAREGVELSAGQQTGNQTLKYAESELGGQAAGNLTERQAEQFTQAALSRAGIAAPRATPEVMDAAFRDLGAEFDGLAARNYVAPDAQLGQDLGAVVQEYNSLVPETARAPVIEGVLNDLVQAIRTGPIPGAGPRAVTAGPVNGVLSGESYQALRSRLNRMARKSTDPELQDALFGIQHALDDAMERTLQQTNPADLDSWRQVRNDYRNLMVLEKAAGRAGESTALGLISPANLRSAVASQNGRSYVRGRGDFADLARAGVATMAPLPQSGTAPRLAVRGVTGGIPSALGALAGNNVGGGLGAMAGMAAGQMVPGILGKLMMSNPGRDYLSNQLWTTPVNGAEAVTGPGLGALANLLNP